jgi:hypothetical protein
MFTFHDGSLKARMMFTFHDGLLKASFNGTCAWSKCSYVHSSKAHNSSIYNDNGAFLGKAEAHPTYNQQMKCLDMLK